MIASSRMEKPRTITAGAFGSGVLEDYLSSFL